LLSISQLLAKQYHLHEPYDQQRKQFPTGKRKSNSPHCSGGKSRVWYNLGMKKRVYIETTVVSYFTARPSRDLMIAGHQEATRELWPQLDNRYETYISALVYEEAGKGDREQAHTRLAAIKSFRMLDTDDEARVLAERIMAGKGIPQEHPEDALHIAVAAVNGMDALVTWNFAHLNNPFTRMMIRQIVENEGFPCPEICSPEELLEADR
jgi:predicted nucleic acid-binding protein